MKKPSEMSGGRGLLLMMPACLDSFIKKKPTGCYSAIAGDSAGTSKPSGVVLIQAMGSDSAQCAAVSWKKSERWT